MHHFSPFPLARTQPYDLRPVVREVGNVVITCVQEEDQNDVLNTKHCLFFTTRGPFAWMKEKKNSQENKDPPSIIPLPSKNHNKELSVYLKLYHLSCNSSMFFVDLENT